MPPIREKQAQIDTAVFLITVGYDSDVITYIALNVNETANFPTRTQTIMTVVESIDKKLFKNV